MTSRTRHRPRAVLAALTLMVAAGAGIAAAPASATPTASPAATGHTLVPIKLAPKPALKPQVARPVVVDTCATARAHLKQYAARHIARIRCMTVTRAAATTPAHAGARLVRPSAASFCGSQNSVWMYDRTEECIQGEGIDATIIGSDGAVLGTSHYTLSQDILLSTVSGIFTENDTIYWDGGTDLGALPGTLYFDAGCGSPCGVMYGGQYVQPFALGQVLNFALAYEDTPGTQTPDTFTTAYAFEVVTPDIPNVDTPTWSSPVTIRCDSQLPGYTNTGCVFPSATPILELSEGTFGAAAVNVAIGEGYLAGSPGYASPLTRGDPANNDSNSAAMCDSTFIYTTLVTDDSCDEYPFASSQQNGGALGLTGSACLEAMPVNLNGTWYAELFNTYTGAQVCERGHVPGDLNSAVGSKALGSMYTTNRVLIGDPYYVEVTP